MEPRKRDNPTSSMIRPIFLTIGAGFLLPVEALLVKPESLGHVCLPLLGLTYLLYAFCNNQSLVGLFI